MEPVTEDGVLRRALFLVLRMVQGEGLDVLHLVAFAPYLHTDGLQVRLLRLHNHAEILLEVVTGTEGVGQREGFGGGHHLADAVQCIDLELVVTEIAGQHIPTLTESLHAVGLHQDLKRFVLIERLVGERHAEIVLHGLYDGDQEMSA